MDSLAAQFLRGLRAAPDGAAFRVAGRTTTYTAAHEAALALAGEIDARVPAGAVGVLASRTEAAYVGALAAVYTGRTLVPLTPDLPVARLHAAVEQAGVTVVVTDAAGAGIELDRPVVRTDLPTSAAPLTAPTPAALDDVAYVMFTSGSTGRPKGVKITHGNIMAFCAVMDDHYDFGPDDVFSQAFDLGFDCAMADLWVGWGAGACLAPITTTDFRDLPAAVTAAGITVWYSAPSAIGVARGRGTLAAGSLPTVRQSLFAGESLRRDDADAWLAATSNGRVDCLWGPTETTITVSRHEYDPVTSPSVNGIVCFGALHAGHDAIVLDSGEICVHGPQVFPGYLDPADDVDRFIERDGRRYYRCGDRVARFAGGEYGFKGRLDDQIQFFGQRIELTEIEHAVRGVDGVQSAAAVVADDQLVVYYTGEPVAPQLLARSLRVTLPAGVVPRSYHHLDALPMNANRKTDRRALRELATAAPVPPLAGFLDTAARRSPSATAVSDADGTWTYPALQQASETVARWLDATGVRRGDRLLVQLPNSRAVVALLYGCARRGVAFVPLNPDVRPYVLASVVGDCTPSAAVVAEAGAEAVRATGTPVFAVDDVFAPGTSVPTGEAGRATDVGTLIYTSGSTAAPKGVVCPQAQMAFAAEAIAGQLGYRADDVVYCRTPLSFDYGLFQIFLTAIAGGHLVLAAGPDLTLLREIRACGATVVPAVPSLSTMLVRLGRRDREPTHLRLVTNTGAALLQATIDDLRDTFPGLQVARMYGITECKRVSIMPPDREFEKPESVGRPLPGTSVAIVDDDGVELPAGSVGQIVVDGPNVMAGYWNAPEITAKAYRVDPRTGRTRLFTGDWGWLDEDGYLYFEGRRDDTFKRKGLRMSTIEIEAAAVDIAGVHAAAALAPDGDRDLTVFVASESLTPQEVLAELAQRLEPAKLPATLKVLADLPVTLNGKPDKKALAILASAPATRVPALV